MLVRVELFSNSLITLQALRVELFSNSLITLHALRVDLFSNSLILVIIPLAVDRFVAVAFPFKYKIFITYEVSMVMVLLSWAPTVVTGLTDIVKFLLGSNQVSCTSPCFDTIIIM